MQRDFTAEAQQELLELVRQVEGEKWCDITDWVGDRFIGLRQLVGELNVEDYLKRMNSYHKAVIDKKNATEADINALFDEVYTVNNCFVARFAAAETRLDNYVDLIRRLAAAIDPTNASYTPADLDADFATYDQQDKVLEEVATSDGGLSQETLDAMDPSTKEAVIGHLISNAIDFLPNLEKDGTIVLPLGMGLVLYYTVKSNYNHGGNSPVDVASETTYGIEEGRARLKDFDTSAEISLDAGSSHATLGTDGTYGVGVSRQRGNVTYSYEYGISPTTGEEYFEESVEVETDHGSVTSTAGVRSSKDQNMPGWRPVPVPVYDPQPATVPAFSRDGWKVVVVGGVILIIAAGVIIFTGGLAGAAAAGGTGAAAGAAAGGTGAAAGAAAGGTGAAAGGSFLPALFAVPAL